jgi:Protein of unknown function (DUF3302)
MPREPGGAARSQAPAATGRLPAACPRRSAPIFLDYLALFILLTGLTLVFYTFIYIHDLPHAIAKQREHPHEELIHVASPGSSMSRTFCSAPWPRARSRPPSG